MSSTFPHLPCENKKPVLPHKDFQCVVRGDLPRSMADLKYALYVVELYMRSSFFTKIYIESKDGLSLFSPNCPFGGSCGTDA